MRIFCIFLIIFVLVISIGSAEPFKFTFGEIPFKKTIDEVLSMVEGAEIVNDKSPAIFTIGSYDLRSYFDGPLYAWVGIDTYFNHEVVKKYTITYEGWGNIKEINLYFVKEADSQKYELFLVRKLLKAQEGNYKIIFNGISDSIIAKIGNAFRIYETTFQDAILAVDNQYEPAKAGVWKLKQSQIFLLVANDWWGAKTKEPEILYLSIEGWQTYIEACEILKQEEKKKQEKEAQKAGDAF